MGAKKGKSGKYEAQYFKTQTNKIKKIEKELARNPNNESAKKSLEFWKTIGRKKKH